MSYFEILMLGCMPCSKTFIFLKHMQIHAGSFPGPAVEKNTVLSMIYTRKWVIRLTFYGKKKTRLSAIINDNESGRTL